MVFSVMVYVFEWIGFFMFCELEDDRFEVYFVGFF